MERALLHAQRLTHDLDRRLASLASALPPPPPPPPPPPSQSEEGEEEEEEEGEEEEEEEEEEEGGQEQHHLAKHMQQNVERLRARVRLFAAQALGGAWKGYEVGREEGREGKVDFLRLKL